MEGYTESTATGLLAGVNMARMLADLPPLVPPVHSMLGALYRFLRESDPRHFQPMNANFGLLDDLEQPIRDKRERKVAMADRALGAVGRVVRGDQDRSCRHRSRGGAG
ncbi:MAG: hypothetical protein U0163_20670 [Gemmatimonadaceae bacterium]